MLPTSAKTCLGAVSYRIGKAEPSLVRILVADDNPSVRHYLRAILEQQSNWQVCYEATTGEEALQKLQENLPDVILLDFKMPGLNGLDAAREIVRLYPATPILLVTVYLSRQLADAARTVGIRGVCSKSDVGSIVEAVQTVLQEKIYFPEIASTGR